jgi:molybdopterin molybdotransferase
MNPPELASVAAALKAVLAAVTPIAESETLDTLSAFGRVLAADQHSDIDVPGMDNAQMDGYAVRAGECSAGVKLEISQRIAAGHAALPLQAGSAARIFTGAPIPAGADAVVMQELTRAEGSLAAGDARVEILSPPKAGDWIRRRGEDIGSGARILSRGQRLRPQDLGLAASVGLARLPVVRRPRVAIFFTGDELAMPGEALREGAIYNSSRFTLNALLTGVGAEVVDLGSVPDTLEATRAVLRQASAGFDCIITSGGVSVGEEDHVRPAVEAEGSLSMWQIAIKPGKPLAFGRVGAALFVGLPGNPVSSFVTFLMFVRPTLLKLAGVTDVTPTPISMRADFSWAKPDRRQEYLRVKINQNGGLDLFPNQGSAVLTSTVWGDGLLENPPGQAIAPGDTVRFLPYAMLDCLAC